jgi:hypothetical protein
MDGLSFNKIFDNNISILFIFGMTLSFMIIMGIGAFKDGLMSYSRYLGDKDRVAEFHNRNYNEDYVYNSDDAAYINKSDALLTYIGEQNRIQRAEIRKMREFRKKYKLAPVGDTAVTSSVFHPESDNY